MLKHSTSTYPTTMVASALATAVSGDLPYLSIVEEDVIVAQRTYEMTKPQSSETPFLFYSHASNFVEETKNSEVAIGINSIKMQLRYQAIERSFNKHSVDFPSDKRTYLQHLANTVCRLPFIDNISSYNKYDESIDTVLKLTDGLTLSLSQFLEDKTESPIVFSLHRGNMLLVSDELPMDEIVGTILSVTENVHSTKA